MEQAMQTGQQPPQVDVEAKVAELIAQYTEEVMSALMPPPEGEVDPLVQLRSKEASDVQRKAQEFAVKQNFEEQKQEERNDLAREKIDSQEDIAVLRAEVNRDRIEQQAKQGN